MKRWQDWVNLVLGAWLVISPWVLGYADGQSAAAWSSWAFGAAILVFAGIAVYMPQAWEEAINILLGVGLLVSPYALGYAAQQTPTSNAIIVGVLVIAFGVWALAMDTAFRERLRHRHQLK